MNFVIGCDIGSQGIKTILLSVDGKLEGQFSTSYGINYPKPGWAEQDPNIWVDALVDSIRGLIAKAGVDTKNIVAIGLDGQVDGLVALNDEGNPLRPAIIWMDRRAIEQCKKIEDLISQERIKTITGLNLDASHVAPKILWLAENEPEIYESAKHFLLPGSFVAYCLTGEFGVDFSNASTTMLMDIQTKTWSGELCSTLCIDIEKLAPIYSATHIIGRLTIEFANRLSLAPSIPIILGCGDEHAACLGAGVISPGLVCDIAGTGEPVCAAIDIPIFDPTGLLETHSHADPDLWLLENPGFVSGGMYRWFRDQFANKEFEEAAELGMDIYQILSNEAAAVPPGSEGLIMLPCIMGAMTPTWNVDARGTYMGFTLAHKRRHFIRALMESCAYGLRDNTDQIQQMGLNISEIRIVGGGAKSSLWRQIKADVTGIPISLPETVETAALGAGILALVGSGQIQTVKEATDKVVNIIETIQPISQNVTIYDEYYHLYRSTYFALLPVFKEGAGIKV
jgi:xylulokinase